MKQVDESKILIDLTRELHIDFLMRLKTIGTELDMQIKALDYLCSKTFNREPLRESQEQKKVNSLMYENGFMVLKKTKRDYEKLLFDYHQNLLCFADVNKQDSLRAIIEIELEKYGKELVDAKKLQKAKEPSKFESNRFFDKNQHYFMHFLSNLNRMNVRLSHIIDSIGKVHVISNERLEVFVPEAFPRYFMRENYTFYSLFDNVLDNYAISISRIIAYYFVDEKCYYPQNIKVDGSEVYKIIKEGQINFSKKLSDVNTAVCYDYTISSQWNPSQLNSENREDVNRIIIKSPIWYMASPKYSLNLVHEVVHASYLRWMSNSHMHKMDTKIKIELDSAKVALKLLYARAGIDFGYGSLFYNDIVDELLADLISIFVSGPFYINSMLYDVLGTVKISTKMDIAIDPIIRARILIDISREFAKLSELGSSAFNKNEKQSSGLFNIDSNVHKAIEMMYKTYIKAFKYSLPFIKDLSRNERSLLAKKAEIYEQSYKILSKAFKKIVSIVSKKIHKGDDRFYPGKEMDNLFTRPHMFYNLPLGLIKERELRLKEYSSLTSDEKEKNELLQIAKQCCQFAIEDSSIVNQNNYIKSLSRLGRFLSRVMTKELAVEYSKLLISQILHTLLNIAKFKDENTGEYLSSPDILDKLTGYFKQIDGDFIELAPGLSDYGVGSQIFEHSKLEENAETREERSRYLYLVNDIKIKLHKYITGSENVNKHEEQLFDTINELVPGLFEHVQSIENDYYFACINIYQSIFHYLWLFRYFVNGLISKLGLPEEQILRKLSEVSYTFHMFEVANRYILERYQSLGDFISSKLNKSSKRSWINLYVNDLNFQSSGSNGELRYFGLDKRQLVAFNFYYVFWEPNYKIMEEYKAKDRNFCEMFNFTKDVFSPGSEYDSKYIKDNYTVLKYLAYGHFDALSIVSATKQSQTISYDVLKPILMLGIESEQKLSHYVVRQPMQIVDLVWNPKIDFDTFEEGRGEMERQLYKIVKSISDYGFLQVSREHKMKYEDKNDYYIEALINIRIQRDNFENNELALNIQRIGEKRALRNLYLAIALIQNGYHEDKNKDDAKMHDGVVLRELYHGMGWFDYTLRIKIHDLFAFKKFVSGLIHHHYRRTLVVNKTNNDDYYLPLIQDLTTKIITPVHPRHEDNVTGYSSESINYFSNCFWHILEEYKQSKTSIKDEAKEENLLCFHVSGPMTQKNFVHYYDANELKDVSTLPFGNAIKSSQKHRNEDLESDLDEAVSLMHSAGILEVHFPTGYDSVHYKFYVSKNLIEKIRQKITKLGEYHFDKEMLSDPSIYVMIRSFINSVMMLKYKLHTLNTSLEISEESVNVPNEKKWIKMWSRGDIESQLEKILGTKTQKAGDKNNE